jgi:hypothetical protein
MAGFGISARGLIGATSPRGSNDQAWQAVQHKPQDGLVWEGAEQMDKQFGFPLDHAGGDFEQPQAKRVELRGPPEGVL